MGFHRILAAIDQSSLSQTVFEQALDLAISNHAQLLLFHCLTADLVSTSPPFAGELGLSPQLVTQAYQNQYVRFEEQLRHSRLLLHQYCQLATQKGISTECDYRVIEPGHGLCQAALNWSADLIILGRRGRKGITEVLLGSVSNYVLHHAPCAVLVIQAEPPASEIKQASAQKVAMKN